MAMVFVYRYCVSTECVLLDALRVYEHGWTGAEANRIIGVFQHRGMPLWALA